MSINKGEGMDLITAQRILLNIKPVDYAQQLRHWAALLPKLIVDIAYPDRNLDLFSLGSAIPKQWSERLE